jgi:hypothetical protein
MPGRGEKTETSCSQSLEVSGRKKAQKSPPKEEINLRTERALGGTTSLVGGDKNTCTLLTSYFERQKALLFGRGERRQRNPEPPGLKGERERDWQELVRAYRIH